MAHRGQDPASGSPILAASSPTLPQGYSSPQPHKVALLKIAPDLSKIEILDPPPGSSEDSLFYDPFSLPPGHEHLASNLLPLGPRPFVVSRSRGTGDVFVWDPNQSEAEPVRKIQGPIETWSGVELSPDANLLAAITMEGARLELFELSTGTRIFSGRPQNRPPPTLGSDPLQVPTLRFSGDGRRLLEIRRTGQVRVWDVEALLWSVDSK